MKGLLFEDNFEYAAVCSRLALRTSKPGVAAVAMLQQILRAKVFYNDQPKEEIQSREATNDPVTRPGLVIPKTRNLQRWCR